jgi:menaquinol-cytochrome c reductase iron-sulfur subunit
MSEATVGSEAELSPEARALLLTRRRFLSRLSFIMMGAIGAVLSIPIGAYLLSPLFDPRRQGWRDLGVASDFPIGQTQQVVFGDPSPLPWAGQTALASAWVRRNGENDFTVFAINCTHLGCPVNWQPEGSLFLCPCHGGVYYADGTVAAGPPPRPLTRYETRINNDGHLEIFYRGVQLT